MKKDSPVFKDICNHYLEQVGRLDLKSVERKLGVQVDGNEVIIPLFGRPQRVSKKGIIGPSGEKPSFEVCVILCKYLLLCPDVLPEDKRWTSYRDLKNSGPLTIYFENDVERAISEYYTGRTVKLKKASDILGGQPPTLEVSYDLCMQFNLLPRIPVLLLYNNADDEFPANCSVLFEKKAEDYLDAECLAGAGRLLFTSLKETEKYASK
jgi:hypothetical protein